MKKKPKFKHKSVNIREAIKAPNIPPTAEPKILLLDTNFVMAPFLYHTDVLEELRDKMEGSYSIFIPSMVLTELAGIKGKRGRDAPNAAAAFKWLQKKIESHEVKLMLMTGSMDPWMLDFAAKKENKGKTVVCTNDVELRKSLKKKGVKVITMLGRKKLAFS